MQGALQPGCLPRLLGELYAGASSGVLRLAQDGRRLAICVCDGRVVGLEGNPGPEPVEPDSPLAAPVQRRLSSMLRDLGIRTRRSHAVEELLAWTETHAWQEGTYSFDEQANGTAEGVVGGVELSMPRLIREAVRHIEDPVVINDALEELDGRLVEGRVDQSSLELTPSERTVLSQVDGGRTAWDVVESSALPPQEARASLFCLACLGAVQCVRDDAEQEQQPLVLEADASPPVDAVEDESTAARREIQDWLVNLLHADHFEVLGVPRDADDRQLREAYQRQVKRFHPDRYADPAFADLQLELQALFIRVGEAYEVLSHRLRRAQYTAELAAEAAPLPPEVPITPAPATSELKVTDVVENALMAEDAILRADHHLLESRYWDAIQILEGVIPWILSQSLKHAAQVRLARAYAKNPYWVRRGEELLKTVVRENPARADAYFALGKIYRANGLGNRAMAMFRKVLDLKPNHGPAAAEIRSLQKRGRLK